MEEVVNTSSVKRFFEDFNNERISPTGEDTVQLRAGIVGNYVLNPDDVQCEIFDWVLHYLEQRKCPLDLSVVLAQKVALHLSASLQQLVLTPENNSNKDEIKNYLDPHQLYLRSLNSLQELCDHWRNSPEFINIRPCSPHSVSICAIKNGRRKMEDRHIVFPDLNFVCGLQDIPQHSYYAVFDGHAGVDTASYAAAHLHHNIVKHPSFLTEPELAIKEAFLATDKQFLERETAQKASVKSGCTALCALIRENTLYLSWLGDSQAVLVKQGVPYSIMAPHKPERKDEKKRIENLGGMVLYHGTWRVNGTLAVSRALGDAEHKPFVTSEPDVVSIPLDGSEDFLILACDGLWDRLALSDVAVTTYHYLNTYPEDAENVAAKLVHQSKDRGSSDNITTVVIFLKDLHSLLASAKEYSGLLPQLHNLISSEDHFVNGDAQNYFGCDSNINDSIKPNELDLSLNFTQSCSPEFNNGVSFNLQESIPIQPAAEMHSMAFALETTAFSELPTPPIDEIVANQKLGNSEQFNSEYDLLNKRTVDSLNIVDQNEATEIASEIVSCAIENAVKQVANDTLQCAYVHETSTEPPNLTFTNLTNECSGIQQAENTYSSPLLLDCAGEPEIDKNVHQHEKADSKDFAFFMNEALVNDFKSYTEAPQNDPLAQDLVEFTENLDIHKESTSEKSLLLEFCEEPSQDWISNEPSNSIANSEPEKSSLITLEAAKDCTSDIILKMGDLMADLPEFEDLKSENNNLLVASDKQMSATHKDVIMEAPSENESVKKSPEEIHQASLDKMFSDETSLNVSDQLEKVHNDSVISSSSVTQVDQCPSFEKDLCFEQSGDYSPSKISSTSCVEHSSTIFSEKPPADQLISELPIQLQEISQTNSYKPEIHHLEMGTAQTLEESAVLEVIPDSVPEAEGVTEDVDSDSEKDGGWSYIKGEITQEIATGVIEAVIDVSKIVLKEHDKPTKTSPPKPPRKDTVKSTSETGARSKPSTVQQADKKSTIKERKDRPILKVAPTSNDRTKANLPGPSKKPSTATLTSRVQSTKSTSSKTLLSSRSNSTQPSLSAKPPSKESTLPNKSRPLAASSVKPVAQRSVPIVNRQRQVPSRPVSATSTAKPKTDISSRPLSSTLKSNNETKSKQNTLSSQTLTSKTSTPKLTNTPSSGIRVPKSRILQAQPPVAAGPSKSLSTQLDTKQTKENANKQILKKVPVPKELPKRPVGTISKRLEPKLPVCGSKSDGKSAATRNITSKPVKTQSKAPSKTASAQIKEADNQSISESSSKQIKDSELEEKGSLEMDKKETSDSAADDPSLRNNKEPQ